MNNEIHIPFGLCDITYDGITHSNLADEAVFNVEPVYETVRFGHFQKKYFLTDYTVSLEIALTEENYQNLKLAFPALKDLNGGLYDDPTNVNLEGKQLTIHPVEADSKEYDITVFSVIIDPEKPFTRTYSKEADMITVKFLGQPSRNFGTDNFKSFFYIGDLGGVQ